MSGLTSVGIIILVMLIQGFLQLKPGVFLLFRHYASARHSAKKVFDLNGFFFMGVETITAIFLMLTFFAVFALCPSGVFDTTIFKWIEAILMIILGIAAFFCYFRHKRGTELFIPRRLESSLEHLAKNVKTGSDAFALGVVSTIGEFMWSLPLYFVFLIEVLNFEELIVPPLLMVLFILISIISMLVIRFKFGSGYNLAEVQRTRVKNREFYRLIISVSYLIIATIIITFRILA